MKHPNPNTTPLIRTALAVAISSVAFGVNAGPAFLQDFVRVEQTQEKPPVLPEDVIALDPRLKELAQTQPTLPVIIILGEQPQHAIATEVRAQYEPDIDALAERVRAIYQRYLPKESLADQEQEIAHSKLLEQYLTGDEKATVSKLNAERERLMKAMREDIARYSDERIAATQIKAISQLQDLGIKVQDSLSTLNALTAEIPSDQLENVLRLPGVAEVVYDHPGEPELNNQVSSLGADTWWSSGFDGGVWDVGVLDSGVLETHEALSGHTFYENMTDNGNHGTGVACMYGSTNTTYKGLAFGLNAILVDDAGSDSTSMAGADWMLRSAGDDPEVINYSWGNGNATGNNWHAFSRFVDGVVADFSTSWAKSAGNNGFGTNTMTVPANNYNALTVANMDDMNTVTRSDDVITGSSSRGPTEDGRKKPDLAAPGNNTMTCNNSGGYSNLGGTSSAAPKVGAATLLLTDGGNWDPKAIKAVLINSADSWEDGNTETTADDGPTTGKEWNKTYGWGYLDLWHAHFHRNDYFRSSVKPNGQSGDFKLYKGTMYNGDKATLVWERDVTYNNASTPTQYRNLSDLDLRLYNQNSNTVTDSDVTIRDNVHQVAATGTMPAVVKVYAYSSSFDGASAEPFALATEEGFSVASGPVWSNTLTAPISVARGSVFTVTAAIRNNGDLTGHSVNASLNLPFGFSLASGSTTQSLGTVNDGQVKNASWQVRAPWWWFFGGSGLLSLNVSSQSYGETFTGSAVRFVSVN
ncbi:MAG: S8 family serine peptidase [Hahellaceae bacterium]|nr:S8 family serine peptidase [Hahellaceae bacterium]